MAKFLKCEMCGILVRRRSPYQRFCPECAAKSKRIHDAEWQREKKKEQYLIRERQEAYKVSSQKISRVAKEARDAGMTYGKYMAMMRSKENL